MRLEIAVATLMAACAGWLFPWGLMRLQPDRKKVLRKFQNQPISTVAYIEKEEKPKPYTSLKTEFGLSPKREALLILFGAAAFGLVGWAVTGTGKVAAISAVAGFLVPGLWLRWQLKSKQKLMVIQTEGAVEQLAMHVRTGSSMDQALDAAAQVTGNPLAEILKAAAIKIRMGVVVPEVMRELGDVTQIPEIQLVRVACELQQKGMAVNIAATFEEVQIALRQKRALEEKVRTLTTQMKMQGIAVAVLGLAIIGFLRYMMPELMQPLFETTSGIAMFFGTIGSMALGLIWTLKLAGSGGDLL